MRFFATVILFFSISICFAFPNRAALVLTNTPLYLERDLSADIFVLVHKGVLVEILEAPNEEFLDKDQNQKFPWYYVKIPSGESGWVFGNNLAAQLDEASLTISMDIDFKNQVFPSVFGSITRWFAMVRGHDAGVYHTNVYEELYVVLTNTTGKSLWQSCGQKSSEGTTRLVSYHELDMTNDGLNEISIELETTEADGVPYRWVDVLSIQTGYLEKLHSIELSLLTEDGIPTPSIQKVVELDKSGIRVEYLQFQPCENAEQMADGWEFCTKLVSGYYSWEPTQNAFLPLYDLATFPPSAITNTTVSLRGLPSFSSGIQSTILAGREVECLRFFEKIARNDGVKSMELWMYISTMDGQKGFVQAKSLSLSGMHQAELMSKYFNEKPLSRIEWRSPESSVFVLENE